MLFDNLPPVLKLMLQELRRKMGVFHPRPAVLAMLALTSASAVVAALPSWSDIFSSLQPYEDEAEEDVLDFAEDEARQFITVTKKKTGLLCVRTVCHSSPIFPGFMTSRMKIILLRDHLAKYLDNWA